MDFTRLPTSTRTMYLFENRFSGTIDLGKLPDSMGLLDVSKNALSANPTKGHLSVVGQDQYPALGEVRETAKLLPRGESPWWRDEGRHLLILCLFSIRGMRLAHMNNAKSKEHAHTCRKARAIFKLRYKKKTKNALNGTVRVPEQLHRWIGANRDVGWVDENKDLVVKKM